MKLSYGQKEIHHTTSIPTLRWYRKKIQNNTKNWSSIFVKMHINIYSRVKYIFIVLFYFIFCENSFNFIVQNRKHTQNTQTKKKINTLDDKRKVYRDTLKWFHVCTIIWEKLYPSSCIHKDSIWYSLRSK